jgi:hypothetical protein
MARQWTCRKCGTVNSRTSQVCTGDGCLRRRPKRPPPAHRKILDAPYAEWEVAFGDRCNICGRVASETSRLQRDHDHATGEARGLLCHLCNRALPSWMTSEWLRDAAAYLDRPSSPLGRETDGETNQAATAS